MAAPTIAETLPDRLARYPRVRFMGSKHRLAPRLAGVFAATAARSGGGRVLRQRRRGLHAQGGRSPRARERPPRVRRRVHARARGQRRRPARRPARSTSCARPTATGATSSSATFDGLYFPAADHAFLDAAWSHLDAMDTTRRAMAITALCLAAARKQPRGVFTITTLRYDDGRRQLRTPLRDLFREAVDDVNAAVFAGDGGPCSSACGEVLDVDPAGVAVAYLDPPYAPPRDDTCYIKRYHFLEGLATYWRGQEIMWGTRSRKLVKRHTPFASKRTVRDALDRTFEHFRESRARRLLRIERRARGRRAGAPAAPPHSEGPAHRDPAHVRVRDARRRTPACSDRVRARRFGAEGLRVIPRAHRPGALAGAGAAAHDAAGAAARGRRDRRRRDRRWRLHGDVVRVAPRRAGAGRADRPAGGRSVRARPERAQRRLLSRQLAHACATARAPGGRSRARARAGDPGGCGGHRPLVRGAGCRRLVPPRRRAARLDDLGARRCRPRLRAARRRSSGWGTASSTSPRRRSAGTATRPSSGAACSLPTARRSIRGVWRSGCAGGSWSVACACTSTPTSGASAGRAPG